MNKQAKAELICRIIEAAAKAVIPVMVALRGVVVAYQSRRFRSSGEGRRNAHEKAN